MADLSIDYLDYLVTAPDALDNSFVVDAPHSYQGEKTYTIEVVTGTLQICVGKIVQANSPVHAAGSKFVVTVTAKTKVYYKAGAGDTFIVGF